MEWKEKEVRKSFHRYGKSLEYIGHDPKYTVCTRVFPKIKMDKPKFAHSRAQNWIRTSTPLQALRPEHSASTNFAIWATDIVSGLQIYIPISFFQKNSPNANDYTNNYK